MPRACGEHPTAFACVPIASGLSPLARGTLLPNAPFINTSRFIPAGAGNTAVTMTRPAPSSVYPRWRGEHDSAGVTVSNSAGLSPLARGTRYWRVRNNLRQRFIPAGAGNTKRSNVSRCFSAVYPRWRGEHVKRSSDLSDQRGLSPLARGTPIEAGTDVKGARFIPAGAGNTATTDCSTEPVAVYPRWRGEHCRFFYFRFTCFGLSPLARGTLAAALNKTRLMRFIPAGAGNTR